MLALSLSSFVSWHSITLGNTPLFTLIRGSLVLDYMPSFTTVAQSAAWCHGCKEITMTLINKRRVDTTTVIQYWIQTFLEKNGLIYFDPTPNDSVEATSK